jgi:glucose/arabinose dehydrogenase
VWKGVGAVAVGCVAVAGGVGLAAILYDGELLSWSDVTPFSIPVLVGILLVVVFALVALALVRNTRVFGAILGGFLGLTLGFMGGVVGPGILGEQAIWTKPPESALYDLEVQVADIPSSIIAQINNPLEGTRSTHSYIAPLADGGFIMVSSAGSRIFNFAQQGDEKGFATQAIITRWSAGLEVLDELNLTEMFSDLNLIRGIVYNEESQTLHFSATPVKKDCLGVELWEMTLTIDPMTVSNPRMLFESSPCLDYTSGPQQFGGRVAANPDGTIYMTVGDFAFGFSTIREERLEGVYDGPPDELVPPNNLGTVIAVSPSGDVEVLTRGHRNAQGLTFDPLSGQLWQSEHGPKGGDELNLIEAGNDYGWPDVTYGGPYGGAGQPDPTWEIGRWYGQNHGEYTEPVFAWTPSIAPSQLIVYRGDDFPAWYGDILVASFKGAIHRLRMVNGQVMIDEPIVIGERPRDLIEMPDGTLLIATDDDQVMRISAKR